MKTYKIVSDTHFCHAKLLEFGFRDFKNIDEMNEHIIRIWNENIGPDDKVIHLGDFAFGNDLNKIEKIIKRLNGNITLILGNHDTDKRLKQLYVKYFKCLGSLTKGKYYFTHEPVHISVITPREETNRDCTINVHGHLHYNDIQNKNYKDKDRYINCNFDVLGKDNFIKVLEVLYV